MPTAICQQCGASVNWSNTRGSRLRDLRHSCGGALRRPAVANAGKPRGTKVTCAVCGRARFSGRHNVYQTTQPHQWLLPGSWADGKPPTLETAAGVFVCWSEPTLGTGGTIYGPCAAELARAGKL